MDHEKEGILKHGCSIQMAKFQLLQRISKLQNAIVIDGSNKHLTAGIIDEHSHIAINGGVNECSESNTSEVRIGDVINSDDINIYRQLSGGSLQHIYCMVPAIQSAGQTALIKLRWGYLPEQMKFESRWIYKICFMRMSNEAAAIREVDIPIRGMGVEQGIWMHLHAKEYDAPVNRIQHTRQKSEPDATLKLLIKSDLLPVTAWYNQRSIC